jgi:uncharacterized membrane protein YhaH (DUF805 family)
MMGFINDLLCLKGRISRKKYWIWYIPIVIIVILINEYVRPVNQYGALLILLLLVFPATIINVKRAHDRNKSGWFVVLLLIPLISLWPLIEFWFLKGTDGPNKYGV